MINGTVFAPFRHDSTWPQGVLTEFRRAVYYRHVHVPGRDCVAILRELAKKKSKSSRTDGEWSYVKGACDKVVHSAVSGVSDEDMFNLANNLLIFANLLLIGEYGFEAWVSVRYENADEAKNKEDEAGSEAARQKFVDSINDAYESLEWAIDALKQNPKRKGGSHGRLNLKEARVLSAILSTHHLTQAEGDFKFVVQLPDTDACGYRFYPHDPVGWVMANGKRSNDRFADDVTSSMGEWSKKNDAR